MTLAICIFCGSKKFGAWVGCKNCGRTPSSREEKRRSLSLSDHFLSHPEIARVSEKMQSEIGQRVPARESETASTKGGEDLQARRPAGGMTPGGSRNCMLCGVASEVSEADPFCPTCWKRSIETIHYCPKCLSMYDCGSAFCNDCGREIVESSSKAISLALALMVAVDRFASPTRRFSYQGVLERIEVRPDDSRQLEEEIRWSGMFCASVILRQRSALGSLDPAGIYGIMEDMYPRNLEERGIDGDLAELFIQEYGVTAQFYHETFADCLRNTQPTGGNWLIPFAQATRAMWFPAIDDARLDLAMALDIGFMLKVQGQVFASTLIGDSANE